MIVDSVFQSFLLIDCFLPYGAVLGLNVAVFFVDFLKFIFKVGEINQACDQSNWLPIKCC